MLSDLNNGTKHCVAVSSEIHNFLHGGSLRLGCLKGGKTFHPAGKLIKHRKQTTQGLQEVPETD